MQNDDQQENASQSMIDTPKTGQTGQGDGDRSSTNKAEEQPSGRKPYFELAEDADGKWHWCYWAKNGRPLAINAKPYERRHDATKQIQIMQEEMGDAQIVVAHS